MSLYNYHESRQLGKDDPGFYSLIMAAVRKADDVNTAKIKAAWPEVYAELRARYNAPDGILRSDCDSAGCFTTHDGICISPYRCIHTLPSETNG